MVATAKAIEAIGRSDLREVVLHHIHQAKETSGAQVNVAADHGIITLTGSVKSETERTAVQAITKLVPGVAAIADELIIVPAAERSSTETAKDLLKALRSHIFLAAEDIRVIVRDGRVTLEGTVHQQLQKMLAEAQVKRLPGIFGIFNQIEVTPKAPTRSETEMNSDSSLSNGSAWIETGDAEAG
jgi:osmotically-inducible protein OsmY